MCYECDYHKANGHKQCPRCGNDLRPEAAPTREETVPSPARGSETPRWGLGDAANLKMDVIEMVLQNYDDATEHSIAQPGNAEAGEIIREGVENFMGASVGVAPAQCLMIGVKYCLRALENWKKYGPEGEYQNDQAQVPRT